MYWDKRIEDGESLAAYIDNDITFIRDGEIIGNIHENPELIKSET